MRRIVWLCIAAIFLWKILVMAVLALQVKDYLRRAHSLDALIECRLREIDYWRELSRALSSTKWGGKTRSPNRSVEAGFARCIGEIEGIERDVVDAVRVLVTERGEVNARIDGLENYAERLILRYRYLEGYG